MLLLLCVLSQYSFNCSPLFAHYLLSTQQPSYDNLKQITVALVGKHQEVPTSPRVGVTVLRAASKTLHDLPHLLASPTSSTTRPLIHPGVAIPGIPAVPQTFQACSHLRGFEFCFLTQIFAWLLYIKHSKIFIKLIPRSYMHACVCVCDLSGFFFRIILFFY